MAIGFLKALEEEKIAVPGDVAIIGCNDDQAASFVTPALSTVKLHNDLIGMMAAKNTDGMPLDRQGAGLENSGPESVDTQGKAVLNKRRGKKWNTYTDTGIGAM